MSIVLVGAFCGTRLYVRPGSTAIGPTAVRVHFAGSAEDWPMTVWISAPSTVDQLFQKTALEMASFRLAKPGSVATKAIGSAWFVYGFWTTCVPLTSMDIPL